MKGVFLKELEAVDAVGVKMCVFQNTEKSSRPRKLEFAKGSPKPSFSYEKDYSNITYLGDVPTILFPESSITASSASEGSAFLSSALAVSFPNHTTPEVLSSNRRNQEGAHPLHQMPPLLHFIHQFYQTPIIPNPFQLPFPQVPFPLPILFHR